LSLGVLKCSLFNLLRSNLLIVWNCHSRWLLIQLCCIQTICNIWYALISSISNSGKCLFPWDIPCWLFHDWCYDCISKVSWTSWSLIVNSEDFRALVISWWWVFAINSPVTILLYHPNVIPTRWINVAHSSKIKFKSFRCWLEIHMTSPILWFYSLNTDFISFCLCKFGSESQTSKTRNMWVLFEAHLRFSLHIISLCLS